MTEQFKEQGGSSTMDPSPIKRWLTGRAIRALLNPRRREQARVKAERARLKQGNGHCIEYFHQVDDGYSHLAVQALAGLMNGYDVEVRVHLVRGPSGNNLPEPELLPRLSLWDAALVSSHYGLNFPQGSSLPTSAALAKANAILAGVAVAEFAPAAIAVGEAVFASDSDTALALLEKQYAAVSAADTQATLDRGDARQAKLKHYSGAMFYYAGEWYWGVDRLYHLESRLRSLGANRNSVEHLLFPRPAIEVGPAKDDGRLTLEMYASLRSPYTALIFDTTVQLAADTGVTLSLYPVLPMVMRGVSLSRQKGLYIFADAKREATALGVEFGKFSDPIGAPVRRCYSLFNWAREHGKHVELMSRFLKAAFVDGVNTNVDKGLKKVVEEAGLSWQEAQKVIDNNDWQAELEKNRTTMYGFNCWGVPSFRLLDANGETLVAVWGQDRLWLVSRKIQEAIAGYSS